MDFASRCCFATSEKISNVVIWRPLRWKEFAPLGRFIHKILRRPPSTEIFSRGKTVENFVFRPFICVVVIVILLLDLPINVIVSFLQCASTSFAASLLEQCLS